MSHNPTLRSALKPLRGPDVRVLQTLTGLGALIICASQAIDLLVVDLETPGMAWPTLLEKLSTAFPEMPVVSTAARDDAIAVGERIREAFDSTLRRKRPQPARGAVAAFGRQLRA